MIARGRLQALVFDFDGLILDTEATIHRAWSDVFARHGAVLDTQRWLHCIGAFTGDEYYDPAADLEAQVGHPLDRAALDAEVDAHNLDLIAAEDVRPGVADWLAAATSAGLAVGVASSSPGEWLETHLGRLGLRASFGVLCGRDRVGGVTKPAPDVYLAACADLGVDPVAALAIEDSSHGVHAARTAGLATLAVPNHLTRHLPFDHADLVVGSLAEVDLADVAARLGFTVD